MWVTIRRPLGIYWACLALVACEEHRLCDSSLSPLQLKIVSATIRQDDKSRAGFDVFLQLAVQIRNVGGDQVLLHSDSLRNWPHFIVVHHSSHPFVVPFKFIGHSDSASLPADGGITSYDSKLDALNPSEASTFLFVAAQPLFTSYQSELVAISAYDTNDYMRYVSSQLNAASWSFHSQLIAGTFAGSTTRVIVSPPLARM